MALLIGPGPGVSTAASSHILARHCPPKQAPFFFSVKQTGVPAGGLLAGALVPVLALRFGWQGAFVAIAIAYVALALLLQPFRDTYDGGRRKTDRTFAADAVASMKLVLTDPGLRGMVVTAFTFVGLQSAFDSFFVIFLVKGHGYSLVAAGSIFAFAQGIAIGARIMWGWIAGRFLPARLVLGILGVIMAAAAVVMGLSTPDWSTPAVAFVALVYAATAFSWNGVLLAEVARLAPADQAGATTGGVIVFVMGAAALYYVVFGIILANTGSFAAGYIAAAIPALVVGGYLFRNLTGKSSKTA